MANGEDGVVIEPEEGVVEGEGGEGEVAAEEEGEVSGVDGGGVEEEGLVGGVIEGGGEGDGPDVGVGGDWGEVVDGVGHGCDGEGGRECIGWW